MCRSRNGEKVLSIITVCRTKLEQLQHFIYLRSTATEDCWCTAEVKIRISIGKKAFSKRTINAWIFDLVTERTHYKSSVLMWNVPQIWILRKEKSKDWKHSKCRYGGKCQRYPGLNTKQMRKYWNLYNTNTNDDNTKTKTEKWLGHVASRLATEEGHWRSDEGEENSWQTKGNVAGLAEERQQKRLLATKKAESRTDWRQWTQTYLLGRISKEKEEQKSAKSSKILPRENYKGPTMILTNLKYAFV